MSPMRSQAQRRKLWATNPKVARVREVCQTDSFVAEFDGLYPTVVEVEDVLRALDGPDE